MSPDDTYLLGSFRDMRRGLGIRKVYSEKAAKTICYAFPVSYLSQDRCSCWMTDTSALGFCNSMNIKRG